MSDFDYLNQIAADNRAVKAAERGGIRGILPEGWDLKKVLIGLGGIILAVILMAVLGGWLGGLGNKERDLLDQLYIRTGKLTETISEYNPKVKSPDLRSMGTALSAVLLETRTKVAGLYTSEYGLEGTDPRDEQTVTDEEQHTLVLNNELNTGWLNGRLDRYYAREMATEIALIVSMEEEIMDRTSYSAVKTALTSSVVNLEQLETQFSEYKSLAN